MATEMEIASLFGAQLPAVKRQAEEKLLPARSDGTREELVQHPKWPKSNAKGNKGKGKGKGQKGGNKAQGSSQGATLTQEQIMEAIRLLTQLALRHEDNINILRQDRAFLLLMKTSGPESMVNALFGISQQWKQHREEGKTEAPLRIALLKCLILELKTRAQQIIESKEKAQTAAKMGWLQLSKDREPCWLPLVWDSANQVDKPVQDLGPLPHSDAMRALDTVMSGADGMIIQRFHSTRPLAQDPQGAMMAFLMEVSNRGGEAQEVYSAISTLCHSALFYVIGARIRVDTAKRTPLANRVQEILNMCSPYDSITQTTYATKIPLFWPFFGHCCLVM